MIDARERNPSNFPFPLPMNGYFVTGTDTHVGKTVLSAFWSPRWTACIGNPSDRNGRRHGPGIGARLGGRAGRTTSGRSNTISILRFRRTWRHGRPEFASIWNRLKFQKAVGLPWIVEGAGGVMVPLNERDLMRDLIRRIGFPVVVAARTALGTINHTLLTLAALREAHLSVCGVVMIGEEHSENRRAIEHYGDIGVIGHIPMLRRSIALRFSMCLRNILIAALLVA